MHKVCKVLAQASNEHRILAAVVFALLWAVLEFYFQAHTASKIAEVFGFAPMADRALGVILGE